MNIDKNHLLTINGDSSSIKFAFYRIDKPDEQLLHGKIVRIGMADPTLTFNDEKIHEQTTLKIDVVDYPSAINFLISWFEQQTIFSSVKAVGHRIVHGMNHVEPELITYALLKELHQITPFDPDHLPNEIRLIEIFHNRYPKVYQVACFDSAFHSTMPRVARLLPIPRRFNTTEIQRFGFHGLSYTYLMEELERVAGTSAALGRVILAHLGNGASIAAVREGKSIDTSMGITPASGLMMGSRSGDLDPGIAWYMMQSDHLTPLQFNHLINRECGLFGVSETTADMQELLVKETDDVRAQEAVSLFCYQAKKWIGAYAAVLGGLDTLVFAGGIGENSSIIRSRICEGLRFLGIELDAEQNSKNAAVISKDIGMVSVRVIRTNEEQVIAGSVCSVLNTLNINDKPAF